MTRSFGIAIPMVCLFLAGISYADRGPVIWNEGVELSQESQKAIILHNKTEEVLILGTEMKAKQETEILEFIPFPSEPRVSSAIGNPFEEVARLITRKGLLFEYYDQLMPGKGGESEGKTVPVEIRFSEKIGLHDVTAIKINDIEQFSRWLEDFFRSKGITVPKEKLQGVYDNARDYIRRGYPYFVFDSVKISQQLKFLEPLVYRFKTDKIYFPLKTSNLIGGTGTVEMILILPGSLSEDLWQSMPNIFARGGDRALHLSSSAKLYPAEIKTIYGAEPFFGRSKIYLQVFKYWGPYDFKDDFTYDVGKLIPYAYRFEEENIIETRSEFTPSLTADERRDMREAYCPRINAPDNYLFSRQIFKLDCGNYIPRDEYEVYSALFRDQEFSGIPRAHVILEKNTTRQEYAGKNVDKSIDAEITKNFNDNNKVEYPLENGFSDAGEIRIRGDERASPLSTGKTYVSRAGFNTARTRALVFVEHITGPRSGVGYFATLEKKAGVWTISGSHLGVIY